MNRNGKITILIVEDDKDFQYLIRRALEKEISMTVIGCCSFPDSAISMSVSCRPDIVLMDLNLSGSVSDGIEASRQIRLQTDSRVLFLTASEDEETVIRAAVRGLAQGYIFKSQFGLLVETVKKTAEGITPQQYMIRSLILSCLSPAEYSIFKLMLGKDISLQSSPKTIANQKTTVLKKLELPDQNTLIHIFGDI